MKDPIDFHIRSLEQRIDDLTEENAALTEENAKLKADGIAMNARYNKNFATLQDRIDELTEAAEKVLETAHQYQFFLNGYANGSASISECNHAATESSDAMNALQKLVHSDQPKS